VEKTSCDTMSTKARKGRTEGGNGMKASFRFDHEAYPCRHVVATPCLISSNVQAIFPVNYSCNLHNHILSSGSELVVHLKWFYFTIFWTHDEDDEKKVQSSATVIYIINH
jgi:hypothetical protein